MVDTRDLKSLEPSARAGSIPALGTKKIKGLTMLYMVNPFFSEEQGINDFPVNKMR